MLFRERQNVFLIVALTFLGLLVNVSIGLAQEDSWDRKADIPTARCFASSCEINGKIYVIGGGKTIYSRLDIMEIYDPATDTWDTTKTDMPTARAELCVAAVNGKIYAIGGTQSHMGTTIFGVVEEYDPETDSWDTNKQPMPTARKGIACGVINNKIYVAGGTANSDYTPSKILEVYDPATDTWTSKANMIAARYYPEGAVLIDTFYVSGGLVASPWTGQIALQKYDATTDIWEAGTSLNFGRVGHTTNGINGKIYAIGGDKQPPVIEEVEEYNPQTMTWTVVDQIPSGMISYVSSVYGNAIFVFSGTTTDVYELKLTNNVYSYTPTQPVSIPDTAFLHALIDEGVDTNGDSLISLTEAEAVTMLNVSEKGISDMTGIEAFVNLETLICLINQLTSIDISNNTALKYLDCFANSLTSLNVSNNTALTHLDCSRNELARLDVSNCTQLESLNCEGNQLTSLNISNNTALKNLSIGGYRGDLNFLTVLDVSNNTALIELSISNMPSLIEVCVWEMPFPPVGVEVDTTGSPNVYFTTDCTTGIDENPISELSIYPNPTNNLLTIETDNPKQQSVEITSLNGQLLHSTEMEGTTHQIDLSSFQNGVYFITIRSKDFIITSKIIKL